MFRPGKGVFMSLNEEVIDWLQDTIESVYNAAGDAGELNDLIDKGEAGLKEFLTNVRGSSTGWKTEKDNFGIKLYRALEWADGADGTKHEYRVTLVITKQGKLKLDIREWYDSES